MIETFWESRPELQHIYQWAQARSVGPFAVLAAVANRAVCSTTPKCTLPPTVGGRASLNMIVALVGSSGGGKGAADAVAGEAVQFSWRGQSMLSTPRELPLGSGEGIAKALDTDPSMPDPRDAVIFTAAEIDGYAALARRTGSTLESEIRKLFSGEQLGFANAGKDTKVIVPAHSYRACSVFGVQPSQAGPLLAASGGGTPQRIWWAPTGDPDAPEERPATPDPILIHPPVRPGPIEIPDRARDAILAHRRAVLLEEPGIDPLDGHRYLVWLKIAAALAIIDGNHRQELAVTEEDWLLAEHLMAVSDATRQRCQRAVAEQSRQVNRARALAVAERDEIVSDRKLQRARTTVLRKIDARGQLTKNQLRMAMKADIRDYLDTAISDLLDAQEITVSPGTSGTRKVHMYHRYMPEKPASTSGDETCTESTYVPTPLDIARNRLPRQRQRTRGAHRLAQQTDDEASA